MTDTTLAYSADELVQLAKALHDMAEAMPVGTPGPDGLEAMQWCQSLGGAAQNLLLAAHGLGLGAMWRTGDAAFDPGVKAALGLAPDQHLIGFIYVGYPVANLPPPTRPGAEDRTVWME